jgi:gas vesicle protein
MSDDLNNKIGWFLAELGLGIEAAILYAPKAGRETRDAIVTGVDDSRKYVTSLRRNARKHIGNWVDSGKDVIAHKKDQINAAIETGRQAVHDATAGEAKHS